MNLNYGQIQSPTAALEPLEKSFTYLRTIQDVFKTRRCRNQHSMAFQIPSASVEAYKSCFFPQTIRDWNNFPDSLISSAEMSDDSVSKFASLVRARD